MCVLYTEYLVQAYVRYCRHCDQSSLLTQCQTLRGRSCVVGRPQAGRTSCAGGWETLSRVGWDGLLLSDTALRVCDLHLTIDYDHNMSAWYTTRLLRSSSITDINPSVLWPSVILQSVYSNQSCKYSDLSDVLCHTGHLFTCVRPGRRVLTCVSEVSTFFTC